MLWSMLLRAAIGALVGLAAWWLQRERFEGWLSAGIFAAAGAIASALSLAG